MKDNGHAIVLNNVSKSYALYSNQLLDRMKEKLSKRKQIYHTPVEAVESLDLIIKKGETIGIVGHNGAGKSTLLKIMAGVKQPTTGTVTIHGRLVALLELGAGFNPDFSGIENIYFYCSLIGLGRTETEFLIPAVIEFAELGEFMYQPLKLFSSGMRARLAFSVSIAVDPDILILDEVLSVGDILFRRKCFTKIEELFNSGKTIIFVSHDVESVRSLCQRSLLFHAGELILDGPSKIVIPRYQNLMFAPIRQQEKIVAQLKKLNVDSKLKNKLAIDPAHNTLHSEVKREQQIQSDDSEVADFFAKGFESKSKHINKKRDIDICDYSIELLAGGAVTHLAQGNQYRLVFKVHFKEQIRLVKFVVWFYSAKSKLISGFVLPGVNDSIEIVESNSRYNVSTTFTCHFNRGIYGIRLVVQGEEDHNVIPLSIINDALLFQVIDGNHEANSQGMVKILDEWQLEKEGNYQ